VLQDTPKTPYLNSILPVGIDLTSLVPGQIYELEITVTDGPTPEVADRKQFLYQGEATIVFVTP